MISSGCVIDTARLMSIVASRVDLDPKNIFGYVLGEHGSNCFTPKSLISIAGQPADFYCDANNIERIDADELLEAVNRQDMRFSVVSKIRFMASQLVCSASFRLSKLMSAQFFLSVP